MNSLACIPKMASSKGRRQTNVIFSLLVVLIAVQVSQCFVPQKSVATPNFSLQQQLTQAEPIKNNEGGEIEIDKRLSNNTESFGTLHPRKDDVKYVNNIFQRGAPSLKLKKSSIESTVDNILKPSIKSMGLFGETIEEEPEYGAVLATSSNIAARLATSMNDFAIANLRLSVFSNFNPDSRKIFCERSCQLLASRRRRGATCVVATLGKNNSNRKKSTIHRREEVGPIVGTAEASFHEFADTTLGRSRPKDSILYVTEVAVDASQRRKGIAKLLMEAIDKLAATRNIETIYLHVDVTNTGAVNLYKQAGYRQLENDNPIFLEFTTKLNLHDGATKGRNHYLLCKDLKQPTWFQIPDEEQLVKEPAMTQQRTFGIDVMSTV